MLILFRVFCIVRVNFYIFLRHHRGVLLNRLAKQLSPLYENRYTRRPRSLRHLWRENRKTIIVQLYVGKVCVHTVCEMTRDIPFGRDFTNHDDLYFFGCAFWPDSSVSPRSESVVLRNDFLNFGFDVIVTQQLKTETNVFA